MMIEAIISMVRYLSARHDDDMVDRMNYLYTPNLLLAFSVLISFKQFGGRPLECMFPNKFPGSWEQYAENFCWSEDTYYLPPEVHVATIQEQERYSPERKLSYYQWVPFFLLLQAACFRFPSFLWKCLTLSSGIRVHDIVNRAIDPSNMDEPARQRNVDTLAQHISRALRFQSRFSRRNVIVHRTLRLLNITYAACFISYMYLITKIFYLVNVITQLYLMNKFLETDKYQWYGYSVIRDIMKGIPWESSGFFPRVSLCDFSVRQVANIQKYSVQCVLVINIFNEKIFILLWFWYTLLLFATVASLVYWFVVMAFPCLGRWFVANNLELNEAEQMDITQNKTEIRIFVSEYLKQDGVFLLRMVSIHAGVLFTTELVMKLYKIFYGMEDKVVPPKVVANNNTKADGHVLNDNHTEYLRQRRTHKKGKKKQALSKAADNGELDVTTSLIPVTVAAGNSESSSSSSSDSERNSGGLDVDDDDDKVKV
ncbi:innexin domain-containing protein [Ditylenchus destructor]|uniref:Innexin n=1 Tax=Ditylenchus destructor TaxID=166010 RepID=A0AAD4NCH1_9BILA|nr:innexin domain-containing protein [Ditylenchus destructor]